MYYSINKLVVILTSVFFIGCANENQIDGYVHSESYESFKANCMNCHSFNNPGISEGGVTLSQLSKLNLQARDSIKDIALGNVTHDVVINKERIFDSIFSKLKFPYD
jgi:hypothetical protein